MTLKYIDGFDYLPLETINYTSNPDLTETMEKLDAAQYYIRPAPVSIYPWGVRPGRFNLTGLQQERSLYTTRRIGEDTSSFNRIAKPCGDGVSEAFLGMACWVGNNNELGGADGGMNPIIGFMDCIRDRAQCSVTLCANGVIRAYTGGGEVNGNSTGGRIEIGTSKSSVFELEKWFYLELHVVVGDGSGLFEVKVNTETVLSLPSCNTDFTESGIVDGFVFGNALRVGGGGSIEWGIDDAYFCDASGSVNNTWLGNVRVKTQFPIGPGASTDFTIGGTSPAATNWQSVLNQEIDDTKFVYSLTPGDQDFYEMDPVLNTPFVHGIQVRSAARMDDATQRVLQNTIRTPLGTDQSGQLHYINQEYTYYTDVIELNPDTGVQFTGTEVNATESGPKVES